MGPRSWVLIPIPFPLIALEAFPTLEEAETFLLETDGDVNVAAVTTTARAGTASPRRSAIIRVSQVGTVRVYLMLPRTCMGRRHGCFIHHCRVKSVMKRVDVGGGTLPQLLQWSSFVVSKSGDITDTSLARSHAKPRQTSF